MALRSFAVAAVLLLSACTTTAGSSPPDNSGGHEPSKSPGAVELGLGGAGAALETVPLGASYIARPAQDVLAVYDEPRGSATHDITAIDDRGVRSALAIVGRPGEVWTEVQLASRPNFTTGWVLTDSVDLTWTTLRIVIDLDRQLLTLLDDGTEVTHGTVAIGTPDTPTPIGITYVSDILASTEPDGPYGPFALGLALFSEAMTEYRGGNGQVGIHGTNQADLLGQAVSRGCVRTHNDLIRNLAGRIPLGTPVEIVAGGWAVLGV